MKTFNQDCTAVIEITAKVTKGSPAKFRQVWLESKTDELECNVYTIIGGTQLIIEINGEYYTIDVAELAGELVNEIVS